MGFSDLFDQKVSQILNFNVLILIDNLVTLVLDSRLLPLKSNLLILKLPIVLDSFNSIVDIFLGEELSQFF